MEILLSETIVCKVGTGNQPKKYQLKKLSETIVCKVGTGSCRNLHRAILMPETIVCKVGTVAKKMKKENKNLKIMQNIFLQLEGEVNDLLMVNDTESLKSTRIFNIGNNTDVEREEVVDLSITSVNPKGEHPLFDRLLDKRIRITVEII